MFATVVFVLVLGVVVLFRVRFYWLLMRSGGEMSGRVGRNVINEDRCLFRGFPVLDEGLFTSETQTVCRLFTDVTP